jgi:hypothetical protein
MNAQGSIVFKEEVSGSRYTIVNNHLIDGIYLIGLYEEDHLISTVKLSIIKE